MWVKSSNPLGSKVRAWKKQPKTVHRHALPRLAKRIRIAEPVTLHQQKTSHENGKWILNQDCNCCSKDPKMDLWVKPFRHIYPEPPWRGCRNRSGMVTVTWKPNPLTQKKDQTFSHVSKLQNANTIYTKYFVGIEIMICINIYIYMRIQYRYVDTLLTYQFCFFTAWQNHRRLKGCLMKTGNPEGLAKKNKPKTHLNRNHWDVRIGI